MAEVAASIIGLVTFGVQISKKLYDAGNFISSVRKETKDVANSIKLYSGVLDCLAERLRSDDPVHSRKALSMAEELCYESRIFFTDINSLLPLRDRSSKQGFYSWKEKVKWYFRKKQVTELVARLEGLKNTVNVLATVLFAGINHREKTLANTRSAIRDASKAVVDYINTAQLQKSCHDDDTEDGEPIPKNGECHELMVFDPSRTALILENSARPLSRLTEELESIENPAKRQDELLSRSENVAIQLLLEWTCVMDSVTEDALLESAVVEEPFQPGTEEHAGASHYQVHGDELSCGQFSSWIAAPSHGFSPKNKRGLQCLSDWSSGITGEVRSDTVVKLAVDGGFYNIIENGVEHLGVVGCTKGISLLSDLACRIQETYDQLSRMRRLHPECMVNTWLRRKIDPEPLSLSDGDARTPIAEHTDSHCRSGRARPPSTEKTGRRKHRHRRKSKPGPGRPVINIDVGALHKSEEGPWVPSTTTADGARQKRPPQPSFTNATKGVSQHDGFAYEDSESDPVVASPRRAPNIRVPGTTTADGSRQRRPPQSSSMNATRSVDQRYSYMRYASPQVDDYSSESSDSDAVVATPRRAPDPRARGPRHSPQSYSHESTRARPPRPVTREQSPRPIAEPQRTRIASSQRRPRSTPEPPWMGEESEPELMRTFLSPPRLI